MSRMEPPSKQCSYTKAVLSYCRMGRKHQSRRETPDTSCKPFSLFLLSKYSWFFCKNTFPIISSQQVHIFVGNIYINSNYHHGQGRRIFSLKRKVWGPQRYVVSRQISLAVMLLHSEHGSVFLIGTDADGLSVFNIAYGIGLGGILVVTSDY